MTDYTEMYGIVTKPDIWKTNSGNSTGCSVYTIGPTGKGTYNRSYNSCKKVGHITDRLAVELYLPSELIQYMEEILL